MHRKYPDELIVTFAGRYDDELVSLPIGSRYRPDRATIWERNTIIDQA